MMSQTTPYLSQFTRGRNPTSFEYPLPYILEACNRAPNRHLPCEMSIVTWRHLLVLTRSREDSY